MTGQVERGGAPVRSTVVYAVAMVVRVSDPGRTADVLEGALGFQRQEGGPGEGAVLDNGAIALRLEPRAGRSRQLEGGSSGVELQVETDDLDGALDTLSHRATVLRRGPDRRPAENRIVREIELAGEVTVHLVRSLTEDDLGILPPLPASLVWREESDGLVRRVLRSVPLTFREAARSRVTRRAESIALEAGFVEVGLLPAVRGLAEATPAFQHATLRKALDDEGIDATELLEGGLGD